jgi:hypothetical protein
MIAYSAFGDEAKKRALIDDIRRKGPIYSLWLTTDSIEADLSSISEEYGLHPAFVRLLPGLGAFGEFDDALPLYESVLDVIPVGTETGRVARETLLLSWTDPVYGRSKIVQPGAVFAACEEIVALVRKSINAPVDKQAWRAARSRLVSAQAEDEGPEAVVDLLLSLAWDLDRSPGAAQDVMQAWTRAIGAEADASDEDQFSDAETEAFEAAMNRINEEAMVAITDLMSEDSAALEAFIAEVNKLWAADPATHDLKTRSLARRARTNAKQVQWRAAIQQKVRRLVDPTAE